MQLYQFLSGGALASGVVAACCGATVYTRTSGASVRDTRGSASVTVGSVSLLAVYEMTSAGLRATISILDANNPRAAPYQETLLLQEGQQRTVEVPHRDGTAATRVTIARAGNGIRLFAGSQSGS